MRGLVFIAALWAWPAFGQSVVALSGIRAQSVITANMVALVEADTLGAYTALEQVVGLEARVMNMDSKAVIFGRVGADGVIEVGL